MRIEPFTEGLLHDLAQVAALADEKLQQAAERMAAALEPSVKVHVLELLGQVAAELSDQLEGISVEVRLVGSEPELVMVGEQPTAPAAPTDADGDDADARISLRLPSRLKERIDAAAVADGSSTNTWIVRALTRATVEAPFVVGLGSFTTTRGRQRLRGYGQS